MRVQEIQAIIADTGSAIDLQIEFTGVSHTATIVANTGEPPAITIEQVDSGVTFSGILTLTAINPDDLNIYDVQLIHVRDENDTTMESAVTFSGITNTGAPSNYTFDVGDIDDDQSVEVAVFVDTTGLAPGNRRFYVDISYALAE